LQGEETKLASTFPDHAILVLHDLFGKPVSTFPDHAILVLHDLFGKPAALFRIIAFCDA
jgi:hypothetical protein